MGNINFSLRNSIEKAKSSGKAIGHFNVSNLEAFNAVIGVAKKLNVPVIIGLSEGERDFFGLGQAVALVKEARAGFGGTSASQEIYLNADHTYSKERVIEAIQAGFDSVIIDGADKSLEENIALTRECVVFAKEYSQNNHKEVLIEGELGYIGKSSKIHDALPEGINTDPDALTNSDDLIKYTRDSGVDLVAPAVGNIHGMVKSGNPALNIQRIKELAESVDTPLVLHGASGITDVELKQAIEAGVAIVHYNTELRVAYRKALENSLSKNPDDIAPYKYLKEAEEAVAKVVEEKLKIMNGLI